MKLKEQVKIYAKNKEEQYNYQDEVLKNRDIEFKFKLTKQESAQELIDNL